MRHYTRFMTTLVVMVGALAGAAGADTLRWEDGRWRLEFTGMGGVYSGKVDREGDWYATGSIEYEVPAFDHATFGLRFYPLFWYEEDEDKRGDAGVIHGAAFGVAARYYQRAETRSGWFGELGVSALVHDEEFEKNSSQVNFLNELGLGYKWEEHWHVAVKWEHISNAGIGSRNSGVNGVGLAFGYTF